MAYDKKQDDSIGAFWGKTSKKGTRFYSGAITLDGKEYEVVMFTNTKTKDTQPDFRVHLSVPYQKPSSGETVHTPENGTSGTLQNVAETQKVDKGYDYPDEEIDPAQIPF